MPQRHPSAYVIDFQSYETAQAKQNLFLRLCYVNYNRHLVIQHYDGIKTKDLYALAKNSPDLQSLALIHCSSDPSEPNAIEKGLVHIASRCTQLKTLVLDHTSLQYIATNETNAIYLPSLSELSVNHCHDIRLIHLGNTRAELTLHAVDTPQLQDIRTGDNPFEQSPQQLVKLKNQMNDLFTRIRQTKDRQGQWFIDDWKTLDKALKKTLLVDGNEFFSLMIQYVDADTIHAIWQTLSLDERQTLMGQLDIQGNNFLQRAILAAKELPLILEHMDAVFDDNERYTLLNHPNDDEQIAIIQLAQRNDPSVSVKLLDTLPIKKRAKLIKQYGSLLAFHLLNRDIRQEKSQQWLKEIAIKKEYSYDRLIKRLYDPRRYESLFFFYRLLDYLELDDKELVSFWTHLSPDTLKYILLSDNYGNYEALITRLTNDYPQHALLLVNALDEEMLLLLEENDSHYFYELLTPLIKNILVFQQDYKTFQLFWNKLPLGLRDGIIERRYLEKGDEPLTLVNAVMDQAGVEGYAYLFQSVSSNMQYRCLEGCSYQSRQRFDNDESSSPLHRMLNHYPLSKVLYVLSHLPPNCFDYATCQLNQEGDTFTKSLSRKLSLVSGDEFFKCLLDFPKTIQDIVGSETLIAIALEKNNVKNFDRLSHVNPSFTINQIYFDFHNKSNPKLLTLLQTVGGIKVFKEFGNSQQEDKKQQWIQKTLHEVPGFYEFYCMAYLMQPMLQTVYVTYLLRLSKEMSTNDFHRLWFYLTDEAIGAIALDSAAFLDMVKRVDTQTFQYMWASLPNDFKKAVVFSREPCSQEFCTYHALAPTIPMFQDTKAFQLFWQSLDRDSRLELTTLPSAWGQTLVQDQVVRCLEADAFDLVWQSFDDTLAQKTLLFSIAYLYKSKSHVANPKDYYVDRKSLLMTLAVSVDITEYKKSIENAQANLKNIILNIPGSLYLKNKKLEYLDCNDFVLRMAGFENKSQIVGKTDYEMPWRHQADLIVKNDKEVVEKGITQEFEETPTLADGTRMTMVTRKTPLRDLKGNIIGVLGISMDISTRKKMEQALREAKSKAEEFNKLKSQFIENMQHDLRSPASGVMQALAYLREVEKDPKKLDIVKVGLGSSEALMALLNEIVESSKKDYSNPVLDEPIKIEPIFESVYRLNAASAKMKRLKFHYRIDKKVPKVVISDKYRLERILLNLVGNAVKFTEKGEVFFEAKCIKQDGRNLLIEFTVKDTGIGIPEDKKGIIFERFVRLDPSNRGIYKGIGLGLTNVREYVRDLEGEFRPIDSAAGSGTTFSYLIPIKASLDQDMKLPSVEKPTSKVSVEAIQPKVEPTEVPTPVAESPSPEKATCGNFLLVEDSLPAQFMTKSLIKAIGCDIDIAGTAEEALEMIKQKSYDLIFADIGLPGMDGIEMTRHIRYDERKKGGKRIPIIGQSANASTANRKACIEAGMQDLLAKPLNTRVVKEVLKNYAEPYARTHLSKPFVVPEIKNTTIIDHDILDSIWKNKEELHNTLRQTEPTTLKDISDFKRANENKDWKQVLFLAHKMRGGFVYLGASRVEEACNYLEEYLSEHKNKGVDEKIVGQMVTIVLTEVDKALEVVEKL
jgi:PAS domain S-box-containing protein